MKKLIIISISLLFVGCISTPVKSVTITPTEDGVVVSGEVEVKTVEDA